MPRLRGGGVDENISNIEIDAFKNMINTAVAAFPN